MGIALLLIAGIALLNIETSEIASLSVIKILMLNII